jgi:hypothetical protein
VSEDNTRVVAATLFFWFVYIVERALAFLFDTGDQPHCIKVGQQHLGYAACWQRLALCAQCCLCLVLLPGMLYLLLGSECVLLRCTCFADVAMYWELEFGTTGLPVWFSAVVLGEVHCLPLTWIQIQVCRCTIRRTRSNRGTRCITGARAPQAALHHNSIMTALLSPLGAQHGVTLRMGKKRISVTDYCC